MSFVKINDDIKQWAWYDDNNTLLVYIRLIVAASWCDTVCKNVSLKRGQVLTTVSKIAAENKITVRQARTCIELLKATNKLTIQTTPNYSVITITDYDCISENDKPNGKQMTNKRQTSDKPTLLNTDIQNNRYHTIAHSPDCSKENSTDDNGFNKFWESYPKKVAKQNALKAWEELKPNAELQEIILKALENQKQSQQWTEDNGKYIPYPASWLNGKRWEDVQNGLSGSVGSTEKKFKSREEEAAYWLSGY